MKTIAVTSGKGGVGKTSLSTNLGIAMAQRGKRVVLFDADLGLANLDVMLGVKPKFTLEQVISGQVRLRDALTDGPGGIKFVAGGSGVEALVNLERYDLGLDYYREYAGKVRAVKRQEVQAAAAVRKLLVDHAAEKWGVQIVGLPTTSGGYMLDFRFRVLDAKKAAPLFVR